MTSKRRHLLYRGRLIDGKLSIGLRHVRCTLAMKVQADYANGITTKLTATPAVLFKGQALSAYNLSVAMDGRGKAVATPHGRIPVKALLECGVSFLGRDADGMLLSPKVVPNSACMDEGISDIMGRCVKLDCDKYVQPRSEDFLQNAREHLRQLIRFGLTGGLLLHKLEPHYDFVCEIVRAYAHEYPASRTLVILPPNVLKERTLPQLPNIGYASTLLLPDEITAKQWDLVVLMPSGKEYLNYTISRDKSMQRLKRRVTLVILTEEYRYKALQDSRIAKALGLNLECDIDKIFLSERQKKTIGTLHNAVEMVLNNFDNSIKNKFIQEQDNSAYLTGYLYKQFINAAREYEGVISDKCAFIPYLTFTPMYSGMNTKQKGWYFYWRDCVREGNYLPNISIGYLLLYMLEMVHGIGTQDGIAGLIEIYNAYQKLMGDSACTHTFSLIRYVWIKQRGIVGIHKLYTQLNIQQYTALDINLYLHSVVRSDDYPQEPIPLELLNQLCSFQFLSTKLFETDSFFPNLFKKCMHHLESTLFARYGQYTLEIVRPRERQTFGLNPMACKEYMQYNRLVLTIYDYFNCQQVRDHIAAIVKHTENAYRKSIRRQGVVNKYFIDKITQSIIDSFFAASEQPATKKSAQAVQSMQQPEPAQSVVVTIDHAAVASIMKESEQIIEILRVDEEETAPVVVQQAPSSYKPHHQAIIDAYNNGATEAELQQIAAQSGKMLSTLIDEINEIAIDETGDILIDN